jgi:hypothetical protein
VRLQLAHHFHLLLALVCSLCLRSSVFTRATTQKQDFLEATPYYDMSNIPLNTYKNKAPFVGKVVSVKRIVGANATGETCHIIIDHGVSALYLQCCSSLH